MLDHLLLMDWGTIFFQHIKYPLTLCDILIKCKSSFILVEYFISVVYSNLFSSCAFWRVITIIL